MYVSKMSNTNCFSLVRNKEQYDDLYETPNHNCKCLYLARKMCEEINCGIMLASPPPSDLPMPPAKWLKQDTDDSMRILDDATAEALEHLWRTQVKACRYAIFHIC